MLNSYNRPPTTCQICPIRHTGVCAALSDDEISHLDQIAIRHVVQAGKVIFDAKESAQYVASVISGVVKIRRALPDGRQQIVGLQFHGGLLGVLPQRGSKAWARAATDAELCLVPRAQFEALVGRSATFANRVLSLMTAELEEAQEWILLLGRKTSQEKLTSFIRMMATHSPAIVPPNVPNAPMMVDLCLSRAEIADFLAIRIETVSRTLAQFRNLGQIVTLKSRWVRVLKLAWLMES